MGDTTEPYPSLTSYLPTVITSQKHAELCNSVIPTLIDAVSDIAGALRRSQRVSLAGSANAFGDDQLNVDVIAEDIIRDSIARCDSVVTASSEEDPVERSVQKAQKTQNSVSGSTAEQQYTIAFDPLDGSSIIAPNWSVGTIIGIWEGPTALRQPPAEKQIASILGVFGPRTIAIVAVRIPGSEGACFEVGVGENGQQDSVILRPSVRFAEPPFETRYFAPANLRAAAEDEKYMGLVTHFIRNKYTLRYSGGLVPDVVHALVKGHGVYISPVTEHSKAKLRRLFELFPLALIVECAGGLAIDPVDGSNILDRALEDINEKAGLVCGVKEDVEFTKKAICL